MEVTVKAFLQAPDGATEVRRMALTLIQDGTMFQILSTHVVTAFPDLKNRNITIAWQDSDNDYVLMSSDEELQDALNQASTGVLKVYVTDIGPSQVNDVEIRDPEQMDCPVEIDQVRHDWEMPSRRGQGRWGGGRGHFRGPFHHPAPWARPHGPPSPFCHQYASPRLASDNSEEGPMMADRRGWKRALRESVPVSHRRWAKLYIHNWRCQNLANATTTSSDSERERRAKTLTTEAAGVPEAYIVWLDMVLQNFHQRWEKSGQAENCLEEEDDADSLATLRMSVAVEFREWARWFLRKRYGKRCSPKFKRCGNTERRLESRAGCGRGQGHRQGKHGGGCRGKWAGEKLGSLAQSVPRAVRLWAKHLIFTWQLEHQVPLVRPQVSDSEELDVAAQGPGVPEDYSQWLLKFLPKWHARHGLIDQNKGERTKGEMAQFKSIVPQEFRDWVKCYLNKHLNKHIQSRDTNIEVTDQHQRWLQTFKTKWLRQREAALTLASSSEGEVATSDTAALTSDTDTDMEMTSSLKRMRLDANKQKSVQFAEDSDSDTAQIWGKKPGPEFRQIAKYELSAWDGVSSAAETDNAEIHEAEMPPHVYRWLCRVMVKMEERKMRKLKKAGKRETRLARKEFKAIAKAHKQSQA